MTYRGSSVLGFRVKLRYGTGFCRVISHSTINSEIRNVGSGLEERATMNSLASRYFCCCGSLHRVLHLDIQRVKVTRAVYSTTTLQDGIIHCPRSHWSVTLNQVRTTWESSLPLVVRDVLGVLRWGGGAEVITIPIRNLLGKEDDQGESSPHAYKTPMQGDRTFSVTHQVNLSGANLRESAMSSLATGLESFVSCKWGVIQIIMWLSIHSVFDTSTVRFHWINAIDPSCITDDLVYLVRTYSY